MLPALKLIGTGLSLLSGINTVRTMMKEGESTAASAAPRAAAAGDTAIAAGSGAVAGAGEQQDRFLKLLVTQMRNQDPLNPLDNAQVTTQLAQISTVTGIDKLNATLQGLSGTMNSTQSLQSAALIGRAVLTPGGALRLYNEGGGGGVELQQAADRVTVTIMDTAGQVVRRLELGQQPAGVTGFQWDGLNDAGQRAANGAYVFQVSALRGAAAIAVQPLATALVSGVTLGTDGMKVNTDLGDVAIGDVKRIL